MKFLQLDFLPRNVNLALLVLRLWVGLPLLIFHGMVKLKGYSQMSGGFPDPLGVGSQASLSMAIFAEVVCAALLVLGLFTRLAALIVGITMVVAFFMVHKGAFTGPASGELAFMYLGCCVTLVLAGGGSYSLDRR